jgi:hypothetical protein
MLNQIDEKIAGTAASLGNGNLPMASEDSRGDDSLFLIYTAEELRWILQETGGIAENHKPPSPTPYSKGCGMVFTIDRNKDKATHSDVYLMNVMWALGRYGRNEGDYDHPGCVTQAFRRLGSYEAIYATFRRLPEGRHTYALGLGWSMDFGKAWLRPFYYYHPPLKSEARVRKVPVKSHLLFTNGEPFIVVFDYDADKHGGELWTSLEVKIPATGWEYSNAWFHHLQLVQIN